MASRPWTAIHLCSGYGGFELALRSVARVRTVAHVERDAHAAAVLVERMGQARLDQAPVWDDVATFDGAAWRGRVDIVTAGFPCPDFSAAGKRAGVDGEHWLWPEVHKVISDVGPRLVILENVPGLVGLGGLTRVLSDLAGLGFDAEWGLLAASAVGAPHRRERVWIVADAAGTRRGLGEHRPLLSWIPPDTEAGCDDDVADADRYGFDGEWWEPEHDRDAWGHADRSGRTDVADAAGLDEREPDIETRTVARGDAWGDAGGRGFPPPPDDTAGWAKWMAEGGPQPVLRRDTDGPPNGLADALHLGGNGLVPQAAALAIRRLLDRLG